MSTSFYYAGSLTLPSNATFSFTAQINGTAQVTIADSPGGKVIGQGSVFVGGPTVYLNDSGSLIYAAKMTADSDSTTIQWAVVSGGNPAGGGVLASWQQ